MLTLILSLLGGSGAIGAALFFVPGLRAMLGQLIGSIPPRLLWALVAMAAIFGAVLWHGHAVESARKDGVKAGKLAADIEWKAAFDTQRAASQQWKRNFEARGVRINDLLGARHDQNLRDNSARADDLRLRGPGKAAACGRPGADPRLSSGPGAGGQPASPTDAPADQVPDGDRRAIVPWGWLVARAEDHDALLSEVTTWRSWHDQQKTAHDEAVARLKAQFPDPAFGPAP